MVEQEYVLCFFLNSFMCESTNSAALHAQAASEHFHTQMKASSGQRSRPSPPAPPPSTKAPSEPAALSPKLPEHVGFLSIEAFPVAFLGLLHGRTRGRVGVDLVHHRDRAHQPFGHQLADTSRGHQQRRACCDHGQELPGHGLGLVLAGPSVEGRAEAGAVAVCRPLP